jgi:hypothetical protein
MINLPNFTKAFEYENDFYLSCDNSRIAKLLAHYEIYKMVSDIPGAIVECGVFKGTSLTRFATFRDLLSNSLAKKIIGFDVYGKFPETNFEQDQSPRQRFIDSAGDESISVEQLNEVLQHKGIDKNVELVKGDIIQTVPSYVNSHPELKISLLNLDTDIYEPASVILEFLFPRIVRGGVLIIDDYGVFPGETAAVDEYFQDKDVVINKFPFCMTPCYIVKN